MFNSGFIPSMDGTEDIYDVVENEDICLPSEFSYMKNLPDVLNQGQHSVCVPCSLSAYFEYKLSLKNSTLSQRFKLYDIFDIYNNRSNDSDGMSIKEAIEYTINSGAKYSKGIVRANKYYAIKSIFALRHAIVTNGPCIMGLPVYDSGANDFWHKFSNYDELLGYHAVAVVGYDKEGFIIRNSWGTRYGHHGYYHIKNEDIKKALEIWTIC